MKRLFLLTALLVAAAFSSCSKHDDVEPPVPPEPQPLAIVFAEGNSLQFAVNETKTVHYTITGGSDNTVVKAEMQTPDDAYTVETTPASATEGTIAITAKMSETENRVVVTVSDGDRSISASIDVSITLNASFDGKTVVVETPGTLSQLLADYDTAKIKELTVIGNLNNEDIETLKNLPKLAVLDMENVNLEVLPTKAFQEKKSLTSIKLPKTLKTIGSRAFYGCTRLTSITIPDGVTSIKKYTFFGCTGLTSITIPDSVTSIGELPFYDCTSLTGVYITDIAKWCAIEFRDDFVGNDGPLHYAHNLYLNGELVTELVIPDGVTTIGVNAFNGCLSLTSITIPDSVTEIGVWAFCGCTGLTSITIPDSVTEIGAGAFGGCTGLTSITIPDSVTKIGAFGGCTGLTSITIPDSVTEIGDQAFYGCTGLTSITIPDGVTEIGTSAFSGCTGLTGITIPDGVTEIGTSAFSGCTGLTSITIPDGVTTIGRFAFAHCPSLTSVTIGNSVTSIGEWAFSDCTGLTSVTIGNSVTEIGDGAFATCIRLTSITIPDSVTKIGEHAFWKCNWLSIFYGKCASEDHRCLIIDGELVAFAREGLTSITIPDSVTSIGKSVFRDCVGLTSITIPDGVTKIGDWAFDSCHKLTSIYCKAIVPPSVGTNSFYGNTNLTLLYVPTGSRAAYAAADGWKNFATIKETSF